MLCKGMAADMARLRAALLPADAADAKRPQVALVTATLPPAAVAGVRRWLRDPAAVDVAAAGADPVLAAAAAIGAGVTQVRP
jgi:hypothetical protein